MSTIKVEIPANRPDLAKIAAELFTAAAGEHVVTPSKQTDDQSAGEQLISDLDQDAPTAAPKAPPAVDLKGVPFNSETCGKAKDPFYANGLREGQWKKRQGIHIDAYDRWYAEAKLAIVAPEVAATASEAVNTQGAFATPATAEVITPVQVEPTPTDCGTFMAWVSKKQAAGVLSQEDIGNAYQQVGVQDVMQLFPPTPPKTIEKNVENLYNLLAQKAGA